MCAPIAMAARCYVWFWLNARASRSIRLGAISAIGLFALCGRKSRDNA